MNVSSLVVVEADQGKAYRDARRKRLVRVLDVTLTAGLCALLMFGPLAFGAVEDWSQFVLRVAAAGLVVAWAVKQLLAERLTVAWCPIFVPATIFAVLLLAQTTLPLSAYRQATVHEALNYCAYGALLFIAAQTVRRDSYARWFALGLSAFGFLLACAAAAQHLVAPGLLYGLRKPAMGGAVFGPYVNRSNYAGLMEMLFPIPLLMSMRHGTSAGKKALWIFAAAVMVGSIAMSQSRGGMLAALAELIFLAAYVGRRHRRLALAVAGMTVLGAIFVLVGARGNVLERFGELGPEQRLTIARDSLRMFVQRPVLGWGLETFSSVYPAFQTFYTDRVVNEAHNDLVQVLVETGLAGFGTMIAFLVLLYRTGWRRLRHWRESALRILVLAALVGCTGILAHSLVDFNMHIPANAALFYVLCGIAGSSADPGEVLYLGSRHNRQPWA